MDDAAVELAAALIRQPTPNPPGGELPLARYLARELTRRGLEAQVLPVAGAGPQAANVFARLPGRVGQPSRRAGGGGRPPLVLCGHLDTVPPGEGAWTRDPFEPAVEGGRLYGLGAADMKGAVAAMVVAAGRLAGAAAAGQPLEGDLLLAFTSGEETRSLGARAFARSGLLEGAQGMVIGEPTENGVGVAEKGGMWLEVEVQGRTAHGSLPHLGANAVAGMAEALVALERAVAESTTLGAALGGAEDQLLGRATLTPTRLAGGVANNVVPDRATATLDVRTLPGQSQEAVRRGIEEVVAEVAGRRGLGVCYVDHGQRPALATPEGHPLVAACVGAVEATLGRRPAFCGLTGATDATELVPPLGLPFVICGPGGMAQAHHPDEWVDVAALEAAVEVYARLARALCA